MPTEQGRRKYVVKREADLLRVSWENLQSTKRITAQACAEHFRRSVEAARK